MFNYLYPQMYEIKGWKNENMNKIFNKKSN